MDLLAPAQPDLRCDACGYPRTGLAPAARCPECGEPAPDTAALRVADDADAPAVTHKLLVTRGDLLWLRTTALGLALLLYSSYHALRVALIMGVGPWALPAINVSAPKVAAAQMLQRSLDGPPGPWGVDGTMAGLGGVLAVWLLTRRNPATPADGALSVRAAARWATTLGVGTILGSLLAEAPLVKVEWLASSAHSPSGWAIGIALLLAELPANALLYVHLCRIAAAVGDRRARSYLVAATWLVPALLVVALLATAYLIFTPKRLGYDKEPAQLNPIAMAAYGTAALAAGAIATAGVLSLFRTVAGRAFGNWSAPARRALRDLPSAAQRIAAHVRRDSGRWPVVAGIALWLWLFPTLNAESMLAYERVGLAARLPMLNFAGPKVQVFPAVASLATPAAVSIASFTADAWLLLALWMITAPGSVPAAGGADRLRRVARWLPVIFAGAAAGLGVSLRLDDDLAHPGWAIVACIALIEAPATILIYLHAANVAAHRASPRLARTLRGLSVAAGVMIVSPLIAFALSRSTKPYHFTPTVGWLAATYGAATLATALVATTAIARLMWELVTGQRALAKGAATE